MADSECSVWERLNHLGWIKSKGKRPSLRPHQAVWKTGRRYDPDLTFSSITHPLMEWTSAKSVLHSSFYWKRHFRPHLRRVRPPQRVDWLQFRSVSARGWPRRGVYCQECVVAIRTNLLHWLWDTRTHTHAAGGHILVGCEAAGLSSGCLIQQLLPLNRPRLLSMRRLIWADQKSLYTRFLKFSLSQRTAPMPDSAAMSKNGIVTQINSRIRTDPFTACYDLVGRELGRWVQFSYWWNK